MPDVGYKVPPEFGMDPVAALRFEQMAKPAMEFALLAGPTDEQAAEMPDYKPHAHRYIAQDYAKGKVENQAVLRDGGWHKGERSERVAYARALTDYHVPLDEALRNAGVSWEEFMELGRDGMKSFVEDVGLMHVSSQLERLHHGSGHWEPNDLHDIDALSLAIVYCDIVVTENQWVDYAKRAQLGDRYGTKVVADVSQINVDLLGL